MEGDYANRWCPAQERVVLAEVKRLTDAVAYLPRRRGTLRWRCTECGCDLGAVGASAATREGGRGKGDG